MGYTQHIGSVLPRAISRVARRQLAPLEPDAFLYWAWATGPRERGTKPITLADIFFELSRTAPELMLAELRRDYVRMAARVRRNQRLGLDPWEGIP